MDPVKWLVDEVSAWYGAMGGKRITLTLSYLRSLSAEIARLTAERDAAIARAEQAEKVAVWAVRNGARVQHSRGKHRLVYFDEELNETAKIEFNGHAPDLYRVLVEASEGGESNG